MDFQANFVIGEWSKKSHSWICLNLKSLGKVPNIFSHHVVFHCDESLGRIRESVRNHQKENPSLCHQEGKKRIPIPHEFLTTIPDSDMFGGPIIFTQPVQEDPPKSYRGNLKTKVWKMISLPATLSCSGSIVVLGVFVPFFIQEKTLS